MSGSMDMAREENGHPLKGSKKRLWGGKEDASKKGRKKRRGGRQGGRGEELAYRNKQSPGVERPDIDLRCQCCKGRA